MGYFSMILENAMESAFLYILNRSIGGVFVILIVMLARLFLRRSPRIISYALWAVVALRLLLPFSIEITHSPVPVTANPVPSDIGLMITPEVDTGIAFADTSVNFILPPAETEVTSVNPMQIVLFAASVLWLSGVVLFIAADSAALLRLYRRLRNAVPLEDGVWQAASVSSPFVWGIVRPRIYLPCGVSLEAKPYILAHERTHIRRMDMLWKVIGCVILTLHWFNPFVWLAFALFVSDMEAACDEAVLRNADGDIRIAYSEALLSVVAGRRFYTVLPPSFGESDPKRRIRDVLAYRKISRPALILAVFFSAAVCIGCAFSLKTEEAVPPEPSSELIPDTLPADSESESEQTQTAQITFPAYQGGRSESNAAVYDTAPFVLTMELPLGWTLVIPPADQQTASLPFTPVTIRYGGEMIGHVGFMIFQMYEGITPQDDGFYRMVYNQLMSNIVTWDREYTPVESTRTETFCAATCRISEPIVEQDVPAAAWKRREREAILAYDTDLRVYIALDFAEGAVDTSTWQSIAESIRLTPVS